MPNLVASPLEQLESEIQAGIDLVEAGKARIWQAAARIQQEKLWQLAGHDSFEAYCKARWGWERSNAYIVASAGHIVQELKSNALDSEELPTSISQIRALKKVDQEQRAEVWAEVIASGHPTAQAVEQAVERRKTFEPGQEVQVGGQVLEVVSAEGEIVYCEAEGEMQVFFRSELLQESPKPAQAPTLTKGDRMEALEATLEVERQRIQYLEDREEDLLDVLRQVDALGDRLPAKLIQRIRVLIASDF